MDKFDVTIEKREFDHNLISHVARCVAAALARSLCECKMLCSVRTYSAQTGNWQARKQTQPVPDPDTQSISQVWPRCETGHFAVSQDAKPDTPQFRTRTLRRQTLSESVWRRSVRGAKLRSVRFRNCEMRSVRFRNCEMFEMRNVRF